MAGQDRLTLPRAVVLLSGGLDSTTLCALAAVEGREIHALTIDYHQRHRAELDSARKAAERFGAAEHIVLPLDLSLFGGSALTDKNIAVEKDVPLEKIGRKIPTSYVPARNTVFLSLALAMAETRGAAEIWIGVNSVDYSGYPDCRPEFIETFGHLACLATKAGVEGVPFKIVTPFLTMSKAEIIRTGLALGVDYAETLTCYAPNTDGAACGRCESCRLRLAGFAAAGIKDPARYAESTSEGKK